MKVNKAKHAEHAEWLGSPVGHYRFSAIDVFGIRQSVDDLRDEELRHSVLIENLKKKIEMLEEYLDIVVEKPECKAHYVKKAVE